MVEKKGIRDTYFRRVFVPIIIAILALSGVASIIYWTPGTSNNMDWKTTMVGGALRVKRNTIIK